MSSIITKSLVISALLLSQALALVGAFQSTLASGVHRQHHHVRVVVTQPQLQSSSSSSSTSLYQMATASADTAITTEQQQQHSAAAAWDRLTTSVASTTSVLRQKMVQSGVATALSYSLVSNGFTSVAVSVAWYGFSCQVRDL